MRQQPKLSNGTTGFMGEHGNRVVTGSQMGRSDEVPEEGEEWPMLRLFKMKMSPCGAYDSGGAYWGCGNNTIGHMYRACDNSGSVVNLFIRSRSRKDALEATRMRYPKARFITGKTNFN